MKDAVGYIKRDDTLIAVVGSTSDNPLDAVKKAAESINIDVANAGVDFPAGTFKRVAVFELAPARFDQAPAGASDVGRDAHPAREAGRAPRTAKKFFIDQNPPTPVKSKAEPEQTGPAPDYGNLFKQP